MEIEHINYSTDEKTQTAQTILLVDGVEHVIISYFEEGREEVYKNNIEILPPLSEKILAEDKAVTTRNFNSMLDWDEEASARFLASLK